MGRKALRGTHKSRTWSRCQFPQFVVQHNWSIITSEENFIFGCRPVLTCSTTWFKYNLNARIRYTRRDISLPWIAIVVTETRDNCTREYMYSILELWWFLILCSSRLHTRKNQCSFLLLTLTIARGSIKCWDAKCCKKKINQIKGANVDKRTWSWHWEGHNQCAWTKSFLNES
jgi:hypothetical protein